MNRFTLLICLLPSFLGLTFAEPIIQKANLRESLPENTIGYIRIPHPWAVFANEKDTVMNGVLSRTQTKEELKEIHEKMTTEFSNIIPKKHQPLYQFFAKNLRSPIELAILIPKNAQGPAFDILAQVQLNVENHAKLNTLLKQLEENQREISIIKEIDKDGYASMMIKGTPFPIFTHYNEKTKSLQFFSGPQATQVRFTEQQKNLNKDPNHPALKAEEKIDTSGHGFFVWINAQPLFPMLFMSQPPEKRALLDKWGITGIEEVSLGWGSRNKKGRLVFDIKHQRKGYLKLFKPAKQTLALKTGNEISWSAGASIDVYSVIKAVETIIKDLNPESLGELENSYAEIETKLNIHPKEALKAIGSEILTFSTAQGDYSALSIKDMNAFRKTINQLKESKGILYKEFEYKGTKVYHLSFSQVEFGKSDIDNNNPYFNLFKKLKQHYYWIEEGEYIVYADLPQLLYDRIHSKKETDMNTWTKDHQLDLSSSRAFFAISIDKLPKNLYYGWLTAIQVLDDFTGSKTDISTWPTAQDLNLPKYGTMAVQWYDSEYHMGLEVSFENNPFDIAFGNNQGAAVTYISAAAVMAGLLVPTLSKARTSAHRTSSNSNIRGLIQGVIIQTNLDTRNTFRGVFATKGGISTLTEEESFDGDVLVGGEYKEVKPGGELLIFKEYNGRHPFGGKYIFMGVNADGTPKKKGSSEERLVLEIYDWEEGDKMIAIGFADAHVDVFPAPKKELTQEDIVKILSVKGGKSLY